LGELKKEGGPTRGAQKPENVYKHVPFEKQLVETEGEIRLKPRSSKHGLYRGG